MGGREKGRGGIEGGREVGRKGGMVEEGGREEGERRDGGRQGGRGEEGWREAGREGSEAQSMATTYGGMGWFRGKRYAWKTEARWEETLTKLKKRKGTGERYTILSHTFICTTIGS